jgi:hypothetical protein
LLYDEKYKDGFRFGIRRKLHAIGLPKVADALNIAVKRFGVGVRKGGRKTMKRNSPFIKVKRTNRINRRVTLKKRKH